MKKRILSLALSALLVIPFAAACGNGDTDTTSADGTTTAGGTQTEQPAGNFDTSQTINVVTREDGSGTRGAFVEIVGVEDADGNDAIYAEAVVQNGTNAVLSTVAGDTYGIGYISISSLNETVKAVKVNGTEPTTEAINDGSYPISRPFNIAYQDGSLSEVAQDFVNFIMSAEGQAVVGDNSLIAAVDGAPAYAPAGVTGDVVVGGSTSVTPVMEALAEEYMALNDGSFIEIQSTGSTAGMTGAIDGNVEIGMASRELSDEEAAVLKNQAIGIDGIAVIVHTENTITDLSLDQVKSIYLGETTTWSEVE